MGDFDHLGDTDVFRKYNIGLLKAIANKLDKLIELWEGGIQFEMVQYELEEEEGRSEFGTTD